MPVEPPEIIETDSPKVACNGGGGALGHPMVYYDLTAHGQIDCGYCGRRFIWTGFNANRDGGAAA